MTNLLKTIAYQIASVDAVFQARVLNVLSKPETFVSPRKIWENLFLNFFSGSRSISNAAIVIIDGLDEAARKTIKELFSLLEDLHDPLQDRPRLSFALFGRPKLAEYIGPKLQQMLSIIEIGEKSSVDIGLYIKEHVKDVLVVRQMLRSKTIIAARRLARDIRDKVMAKAHGMFFKVVLIMNQLYDKERTSYVFQAINDVPPQLEAMIGHVFERLLLNEDVNKEDLNEILTWVTIYEYEDDDIDENPDEDNAKKDDSLETDLFSDEGDLQEDASDEGHAIIQSRGDGNDSIQEDTLNQATVERFNSSEVRFTHASIGDFLVRDRNKSVTPLLDPGIGIDPPTADLHLASMCLQRLLDYDFQSGYCDILPYATVFYIDPLLSIEASIGIEEKQHIIHQLCGLFFDPTGLRKLVTITYKSFNKALHQWFESPKFSTTIMNSWLNSATREQYSAEEWGWIRNATLSREEFFRPLATEALRTWLSKTGSDDPAYPNDNAQLYQAWIVHCYLTWLVL